MNFVIEFEGQPTEFQFKYNLLKDTPENIADEMTRFFKKPKTLKHQIAREIKVFLEQFKDVKGSSSSPEVYS